MSSGGGSTSSTNVSIPPEQWFEAIAREQLSQNAYNKAQQGQNFWNMGNQMMGLPAVNYNNPYPATPTGPFEWTHDQHQGSSWGRDFDGKNMEGPGGVLQPGGGNANGSGLKQGPSTIYKAPWELGYDPTGYVKHTNENAGTEFWTRPQRATAQGSSGQFTPAGNRGQTSYVPTKEVGNQNYAMGRPSSDSTRGGASAPNTSPRYGIGPNGERNPLGRNPSPYQTQEIRPRYGIGPNGERNPLGRNPSPYTGPDYSQNVAPGWQQRMNDPLMKDFGEGLNRMDYSLGQAHSALGNQGASLGSATGAFNKAGGYFDKAGGAFSAGNQYAGQAASAAQGSQKFFDKAAGSADKMAAPISKLGALGDEMQNTLLQGKLPDSYQENWIKGNQRGFDEMMGSNLNSLASRGVINSSVANRSLGEATERINESYARNFLDSMAAQRANFDSTAGKYTDQLGGLGQQANAYQGAGQGYIGSANALSTAGQTANASGQGMLGAGQGYLGVGQGHLGAAQGWGSNFQNSLTNAQASMLPYQTRLSGAQEMMGIGDTMDNDLRNLYSMWSSHRYGVPGDTIVSQGK
jgi:hypothetical protein